MIPFVNSDNERLYDKRLNETHKDSHYNPFDAYKTIAIDTTNVLLNTKYIFNERFSDILSEAIMKNNLKLLSKEQYEVVYRYFNQADSGLVDTDLIQLDEYLGGIV